MASLRRRSFAACALCERVVQRAGARRPPTPWRLGGCIAAAMPLNFVWVSSNNGLSYYTKDGGKTWKLAEGLPADGWIFSAYLKRRIVVADCAQIGTWYSLCRPQWLRFCLRTINTRIKSVLPSSSIHTSRLPCHRILIALALRHYNGVFPQACRCI